MSASVSRVVDLAVSVSSTGVARAGFNKPMVVGHVPVSVIPGRHIEVADPDELLDLGLTVDHPTYRAVSKLFSQTPHPQIVIVGRRALPATQVLELTPTNTTEGFTYSFQIRGLSGSAYKTSTIEYTNGAAETPTTISTAIKALIDAEAFEVVVTGTASIVLTADISGGFHLIEVIRAERVQAEALTFADNSTDPGIATDLAAIWAATSSFYGFVLDSQSKAEVVAAAAWAASRNVLFVYDTSDAAVASATAGNVMATLQTASQPNTFGIYKQTTNLDWAAGALMAVQFPEGPGTSTWVYKTLASVYADDLSETVITNVAAQNGTCYVTAGGKNVTWPDTGGKVADGEWVDIVRGSHFLEARIQESVLGTFIANKRIPFTEEGVNLLKDAVEIPMQAATDPNGQILVPNSVKISASSIASQVRSSRSFDGIFAEALLSGAIHKTKVRVRLQQ